jgi:hypothetical protein
VYLRLNQEFCRASGAEHFRKAPQLVASASELRDGIARGMCRDRELNPPQRKRATSALAD